MLVVAHCKESQADSHAVENAACWHGYASRKTPSEGVNADLFAKAMAFEDSEGHKALLVTADIIGFPGEIAESIAARLRLLR